MKIVVLDGYTENPGDLSWEGLERLGDLTVYDRTPADKIAERLGMPRRFIPIRPQSAHSSSNSAQI